MAIGAYTFKRTLPLSGCGIFEDHNAGWAFDVGPYLLQMAP